MQPLFCSLLHASESGYGILPQGGQALAHVLYRRALQEPSNGDLQKDS
jgi:hypothetical protein